MSLWVNALIFIRTDILNCWGMLVIHLLFINVLVCFFFRRVARYLLNLPVHIFMYVNLIPVSYMYFSAAALLSFPSKNKIPLNYMIVEVGLTGFFLQHHSLWLIWSLILYLGNSSLGLHVMCIFGRWCFPSCSCCQCPHSWRSFTARSW